MTILLLKLKLKFFEFFFIHFSIIHLFSATPSEDSENPGMPTVLKEYKMTVQKCQSDKTIEECKSEALQKIEENNFCEKVTEAYESNGVKFVKFEE